MKESPYVSITEEKAKQDTIQGIIFAVIMTFGMLSVLVYGLAWMSSVEKENTAFYGAKHLEKRVKWLETWSNAMVVYSGQKQVEYENHTHRYYDGRVK